MPDVTKLPAGRTTYSLSALWDELRRGAEDDIDLSGFRKAELALPTELPVSSPLLPLGLPFVPSPLLRFIAIPLRN